MTADEAALQILEAELRFAIAENDEPGANEIIAAHPGILAAAFDRSAVRRQRFREAQRMGRPRKVCAHPSV